MVPRQRYEENPLFIPETDSTRGAYHVFYAMGPSDAMGFAPFAIDELGGPGFRGEDPTRSTSPIAKSYDILTQLAPVILENQGKGKMAGAVLFADEPPEKIPLGNYVIEASYWQSRMRPAPPPQTPPPCLAPRPRPNPRSRGPSPSPMPAGAIFISVGTDQYIIAGSGTVSVTFSPNTPGDPIAGILSIDEGTYVNGQWVAGRRLNGDENGQGKLVRIGGGGIQNGRIQRVKLYRYR